MRNLFALICFASLLVISLDARAELRGKDRKEAGKMVYATIYLRTDVPTNDAVEPFVEVSPSGYSWERLVNQAEEKAKRKNKPSGVYYPFRPNDIVKWGSVSYDHDTMTVWFQGILDELKVRFVQINTLDDFQKAFDHLFSRVPLQDEHSDWPAEVKSAIADRRVVESMTKEQASCVVGTPLKTDTTKEGEASVEVWYLRQDTGDTRGGKHRASTGLPKSLKFVNDKLTAIDK